MQANLHKRLREARAFLAELPQLPDLQCAWLLLLYCAAPRAQHLLRTVPPVRVGVHAREHDDAVLQTLQDLLGGPGPGDDAWWPAARDVAFLPAPMGGQGLLHAERLPPAAYWAAWAEALPVQQRCPAADRCLRALQSDAASDAPSLQAARDAAAHLDGQDWDIRPAWQACMRPAARTEACSEPSL